jgi:hypothetical protein
MVLTLAVMNLLVSATSFAEPTNHAKAKHEFTLAPKDNSSLYFDQAKLDAIETQAEARGNRKIAASTDVTASPAMQSFEKEFFQITTGSAFDAELSKLSSNYDSYTPDVQFVVAQLLPLKALRGIIYRMIPLVRKQRITHSALLTIVKETAEGVHVFLPTDQWKAGFEYITEPFTESDPQFQDEVDFQRFLAETMKDALSDEAKRLNKLNLDTSPAMVFDNQIFYGTASFQDGLNRYRIVGEADKATVLSGVYGGIANIDVFCSYNVDQLLQLAADEGHFFGLDGFNSLFTDNLNGAPSMERIQKLQESKFKKLFTKTTYGNEWMQDAYQNITMSVHNAYVAWKEVKQRSISDYWVLDPRVIAPMNNDIHTAFVNMKAVLNGQPVRSAITGDVVTLSLKDFFFHSPDDLKDLLPNGFHDSTKPLEKTITDTKGHPVQVQYRNYLQGRPTAWKVVVYQKYFPNVKTNADIETAARVLAQTWGGPLGSLPLSFIGF